MSLGRERRTAAEVPGLGSGLMRSTISKGPMKRGASLRDGSFNFRFWVLKRIFWPTEYAGAGERRRLAWLEERLEARSREAWHDSKSYDNVQHGP